MGEWRDVVVVGAGPGGSAAAHYLARRGVDVLLVDKAEFPREKTCGDGLTPRAAAVLHDMGVLDALLRVGRPISGAEIVSPDGYSTGAPVPSQRGVPASMLVVPRITLDNVLRKRAIQSGAQFEGGVLVSGVEAAAGGVVIKAEQAGRPLVIKARMAMLATGASIGLLKRLGLLAKAPAVMLAARAYFDGIRGLTDRIQIRFDGVPLPGYGWIFPVSPSSANVGAGFFPPRWSRRAPASPRAVLDMFLRGRFVSAALDGARQAGPAKSYPLRVDFPDAPTFGGGMLLVGEAAGLVNPLTGEGIDYALESAQIAAEHAARGLAEGTLSLKRCEEYDRHLRARFGRLFMFCRRVSDASLNATLLNRLARIALGRDDLKMLLINVALGNREVSETLSVATALKKAFALAR